MCLPCALLLIGFADGCCGQERSFRPPGLNQRLDVAENGLVGEQTGDHFPQLPANKSNRFQSIRCGCLPVTQNSSNLGRVLNKQDIHQSVSNGSIQLPTRNDPWEKFSSDVIDKRTASHQPIRNGKGKLQVS